LLILSIFLSSNLIGKQLSLPSQSIGNMFYCAFGSFKVIEKFMFDKLEDNPSSQERWIEPIQDKLSSKSPTFLQRCMQNFSGYKG
jgi:hypothetical protein